MENFICKYCGRIAKSKLSNSCHERLCDMNKNHVDKTFLSLNAINTNIKLNENRKNKYKDYLNLNIDLNKEYICENCGKIHNGTYASGRFCSKQCARSFSTKNNKDKTKNAKCIVCGKDIIIKLNSSIKTCKCNECKKIKKIKNIKRKKKKKKQIKQYKEKPKYIDENSLIIDVHKNGKIFKKIISEETRNKLREAGKKSARNQAERRRSKAEIYFYDLCSNYFKNVKHNEPIFNGWDADIIIEDIKFAILWNGPCHYEPIFGEANLNRVVNRDKIKIHEIEKANYIPYIIENRDKYHKEFVEEKFEEFLNYLKENNYI